MAAKKKAKALRSEETKSMTAAQLKMLQDKVAKMESKELEEFRNAHVADQMGFDEEEGYNED